MLNLFSINTDALCQVDPLQARKLEIEKGDLPIQINLAEQSTSWQRNGSQGSFIRNSTQGFSTVVPEKKLYILYGLGDGDYLNRLSELDAVKEILVFEPSVDLFRELMTSVDFRPLIFHPKIRFILGTHTQNYISEIQNYLTKNIERYRYAGNFGNIVTPGVEKVPGYEELFLKFAEAMRFAISNVSQRTTASSEDAYRGFVNSVRNYNDFCSYPCIDDFRGIFKDVPAIVVASGPSLQHSLKYLKEVSQQAVIICCDSTLKPLIEAGIRPHFIVCLERDEAISNSLDVEMEIYPHLIVPLSGSVNVQRKFPGKKITIGRDVGFDSWLFPKKERHFLGQSVSQMALMVAYLMGCPAIYLIGVDCAYDPYSGGSHHIKVSNFIKSSNDWLKNDSGTSIVEIAGYDGKPKQAHAFWCIDNSLFTEMIKRNEMTVFHVTPKDYGLPILGSSQLSPSDFFHCISKLGNDPKNIFDPFLNFFSSHLQNDGKNILKDFEKYFSKLGCISLEQLDFLNEQYYSYWPYTAENIPRYATVFSSADKVISEIVYSLDSLYLRTLYPILQGDYARTGYLLSRIPLDYENPSVQIVQKLDLYRKWFSQVYLWSGRILHVLRQEFGERQ